MLTLFTLLGGYWCSEIKISFPFSSSPSCGSGNYRIAYDKKSAGNGAYELACCMNYETSKPNTDYGLWCDSFSTTEISPAKYIGSFYASSSATEGTKWYCNGYEKPPKPTPIMTFQRTYQKSRLSVIIL